MTRADLQGYRKMCVSLVALGLAFWLAMVGKLASEFVQIAVTVIAAFSAANAVEHYKKAP